MTTRNTYTEQGLESCTVEAENMHKTQIIGQILQNMKETNHTLQKMENPNSFSLPKRCMHWNPPSWSNGFALKFNRTALYVSNRFEEWIFEGETEIPILETDSY